MQCPKCLSSMEVVHFNEIEVERCTNCRGLFFDHLERESLRQMEGAEGLDIGDDFIGATYNEILDVPCPKCSTRMDHIVHHDPFEIKLEHCPSCKGIFLDAGEFRDYLADQIYEQFQKVVESL